MQLNSFCVVVRQYDFEVYHSRPIKFKEAERHFFRMISKYVHGRDITNDMPVDFETPFLFPGEEIPNPVDVMFSDEWHLDKLRKCKGDMDRMTHLYVSYVTRNINPEKEIVVFLLHSSRA